MHKKALCLVIACCASVSLSGCLDSSSFLAEYFSAYKQETMEEHDLEQVIDYAKLAEGASYKWGGDTLNGFDCSGLIQWIFRQMGHGKFRDGEYVFPEITAHNLYHFNSEPVADIEHMQRGYFIFFDENGDGHINHNAIFDRIDERAHIWVYDAYSVTGLVGVRIVEDFYQKNPIFARPLKTILK